MKNHLSLSIILMFCVAWLLGCQEESVLTQRGGDVLGVSAMTTASPDAWVEAECASGYGEAWQSGTADGVGYLEVKAGYRNSANAPDREQDKAHYTFRLPSGGNYYFFSRVLGPDSGSDSFWYRLDEGDWQMSGSVKSATFTWFSLLTTPVSLSPGSHTLELSYREDGVKLDKFLFSTSSGLPSGAGVVSSDCSHSSETQTVQVNFADEENTYTDAGWNHFNQTPVSGTTLRGLKNTAGQASGINVAITTSGFTASDKGPATGDESGVVPDGVMKRYYYVSGGTPQGLKVTGLDPSARYSFTFYGGSSYSGDRTTVYRIGEESGRLNASGNTSETVQLTGLRSDSEGGMVIEVSKAEGASYGFLNAMIITANGTTAPPPGDEGDLPNGLPALQLISDFSFEDNVGRNVSEEQDNLKVHHLGRTDGKVEKHDGVGAYHFRITPGDYTEDDPSHRLELIPQKLPSPYFRSGWRAQWGQEYVYQIRVKLTENYELGREYSSIFNGKNDYSVPRVGCFAFQIEGDHYLMRQYYARESGVGGKGTPKLKRYDRHGRELTPGVDFDTKSYMGNGYAKVSEDRGQWITWTLYVKWSYGDDGFFRLYKNGELFHADTGPNGYKDTDGPYVKFGLYNSFWKNGNRTGSVQKESYVDYLRIYVPE